MAIPFGKLAILIGAGIAGSVLAKEGRLSTVSDFISGTFKILNPSKPGSSGSSRSKPNTSSLEKQVASLKQQLEVLASSHPITTIVTTSGAGGRKYGVLIIVVVVGCGYIWWKGWKLPDMMFATKRGLSDACNSVARQLEDVYKSISATQRQLSSKITSVDCDVNRIVEISQATKEEVSLLRGKSRMIGEEFQSVRDVVQTLESKLNEIEGKQDITTQGVKKLCDCAWRLDNGRTAEHVQASLYSSSREALELPAISPSSRTGSLPPALWLGPPSPSDSNGSQKVEKPRQNSVSAFGLKEFNVASEMGESSSSPKVSTGNRVLEESNNKSSSNGLFARLSASVLTRQRSATSTFAQAALSSGQQC